MLIELFIMAVLVVYTVKTTSITISSHPLSLNFPFVENPLLSPTLIYFFEIIGLIALIFLFLLNFNKKFKI